MYEEKRGHRCRFARRLRRARRRSVCVGASVAAQGGVEAPKFEVDPFWPKPLPNHWVMGSTIGISIDSRDHVLVIHRQGSLGRKHYARGIAYDALEEFDNAPAELNRIAESEELRNMMEMVFARKYTAEGVVAVASNVLRAEILATEGNLDEAIRVMEIAVRHQDALGYTWSLPRGTTR